MVPWTKKYQPKNTSQIQGQDKAVDNLKSFVDNFDKATKKAVIVYGPTGCGKTSSVYALAAEFDLEILEVNASDFRNADQINSIVGASSQQRSLFNKGKIILVDEVDGISGAKDRGGISALTKLIAKTRYPILITANNPYEAKFSTLRKKCEIVEFHTLAYTSVYKVLKRICENEKIKYDETTLKSLARRAGGDLRGAVIDLEILTRNTKELSNLDELGDRRQTESMIQALLKVFKTTDAKIAITAYDDVEEDIDKIFLWVDQNLPVEYEKPEDLASAYDKLSKADVFYGRIRRWQHWRYLVYVYALLSAGIAVSKDEKYKKFVSYKPTTRILKLWWAKQRNMKKKAIAAKIAEATHSSTKQVVQNIEYFKVMFKKNKEMADSIAAELELDKEEVEWLKKK